MPVVEFARLLFSIMPTPEGQNDVVFDRLIASLNVPWDKSRAMPLGCLSVRQGRQHPTPPAGTAPTTASNEPPEDVMAQLIAEHNDAMDDLRVQIIEQVFRIEELEHQVKVLEAERAAQMAHYEYSCLATRLPESPRGVTEELLNVGEREGASKEA